MFYQTDHRHFSRILLFGRLLANVTVGLLSPIRHAFEIQICGYRTVQAALVGDSGSDMETAVRAGMLPVGAGWGFRSAEELIAGGARKLAAQPIDLISILTG